MPQMDPTTFASQLFWLAVTFVVLYALMSRLLLPRIQGIITAREAKIAEDVTLSERFSAEAETAKATYEKALAESRARAQSLIAESLADIAKMSASRQDELDATLAVKVSESEAAIRTAKRNALQQLTPASQDLAALIVEKLVHQKPSADKVAAVVNEVAKARQL